MKNQKIILLIGVCIIFVLIGGFYYLGQSINNKQKDINNKNLSLTKEPEELFVDSTINFFNQTQEEILLKKDIIREDNFEKRLECEKFKNEIQNKINSYNYSQKPFIGDSAVPGNSDDPIIPRLYLYNRELVEVFYSPLINSCLYLEVSRTYISDPEQDDNKRTWGISFETYKLINYLTNELLEIEETIHRSEIRSTYYQIQELISKYK
jgi:hypothetical protein